MPTRSPSRPVIPLSLALGVALLVLSQRRVEPKAEEKPTDTPPGTPPAGAATPPGGGASPGIPTPKPARRILLRCTAADCPIFAQIPNPYAPQTYLNYLKLLGR